MATPTAPIGTEARDWWKRLGIGVGNKNAMANLAKLLLGLNLPGIMGAMDFQGSLQAPFERSVLELVGDDQAMLDKIRNASLGNAAILSESQRASGQPGNPYDFTLQALMDTNAASRDYISGAPQRRIQATQLGANSPYMQLFGNLAPFGANVMQNQPRQGQDLGGLLGGLGALFGAFNR